MIICTGEALVDMVPAPRPGGGPMNTAIATARLGVPTAFLGRVSTDPLGDLIWRHLSDSGIDLSLTQRGDEPTCLAIVDGDPPVFTFQGDGTADTRIEPPDMRAVGPGPHILHGGTLGLFRRPAATVLADVVAEHDGLVSLDPNVRPQIIGSAGRPDWMTWFRRWLANTGVLRASDADLDWIFPDQTPEQIAPHLFDSGVRAFIVTTSDGATVHTPSGSATTLAQHVDVVDTIGAGDSFCGGFLVCLHEAGVRTNDELDDITLDGWVDILDFACRVATATVQKVGADPPWRTDLG